MLAVVSDSPSASAAAEHCASVMIGVPPFDVHVPLVTKGEKPPGKVGGEGGGGEGEGGEMCVRRRRFSK